MPHETMNALSGQKDAIIVASATVGSGFLEWIGVINGVLGAISLTVGIVLACLLIIFRYREMVIMTEREHKRRKEDE